MSDQTIGCGRAGGELELGMRPALDTAGAIQSLNLRPTTDFAGSRTGRGDPCRIDYPPQTAGLSGRNPVTGPWDDETITRCRALRAKRSFPITRCPRTMVSSHDPRPHVTICHESWPRIQVTRGMRHALGLDNGEGRHVRMQGGIPTVCGSDRSLEGSHRGGSHARMRGRILRKARRILLGAS
jgi:hypothetical protein